MVLEDTITIKCFWYSDHCQQWFFNGFGVAPPLVSMVFDGQGPLVKRWNGFNGSNRSSAVYFSWSTIFLVLNMFLLLSLCLKAKYCIGGLSLCRTREYYKCQFDKIGRVEKVGLKADTLEARATYMVQGTLHIHCFCEMLCSVKW